MTRNRTKALLRSLLYSTKGSGRAQMAALARVLLGIALVGVYGLGLTTLGGRVAPVTAMRSVAGHAQEMSEQAARQISALVQEKLSRTPAQRKIDSQLLYEIKKRGIGTGPTAQKSDVYTSLQTGVDVDEYGQALVDIKATSGRVVARLLRRLGAEVTNVFPRDLRARVPLDLLEKLSSDSRVIYIMPAATYMLNVVNVSEGDTTHGAQLARSIFTAATGNGVKVGVLSDGVNSLATLEASGDLPTVTVLTGQAGSGDEGSAMLEIVHDLAPDAQLFFATAGSTIPQFAQNIQDLRTAGCDIIVDDVTFFVETPFQDGQAGSVASPTNAGLVIQAVNDVTADGAMYFSSAANSGNLDDGTAGVWEGDFADGGAAAAPIPGGTVHDFGGGQTFNVLTGATRRIDLKWSDPLGGSGNDYDLFLLDSTGTSVVASSTNTQDGNDDPIESVSRTLAQPAFATGSQIVIVQNAGAAGRFLHLNTNRGRLSIGTSGVTFGHNAPKHGFGVAAAPAHNPFDGISPAGPFPGLFTSTQLSELFTSDGPRRIFFNADSTPITPGNFSSTGGELLMKPDFTAADGVACAAPGFNPFFGTSAAAPHAAAIAALIKSFNPSLTAAQIGTILTSTAIDIEGAGWDRDTGIGIVMANLALDSLCSITCPANITQSTDSGQCTAVVAYSPPTVSGSDCGTITCSPASGSAFPVGTTTVTCTTTAGPSCSFTITVSDTQPPTISCPANVTAFSAVTCPPQASTAVTFPAPTASDNCPGVTVACTPPSGSPLPVGTTTVTCTATDVSGNTASCSFAVVVFDGRLQDDSNPNNVLLFNTKTGAYTLCCGGTTLTGTGSVILRGCLFTLQHYSADRRLSVSADFSQKKGTATLQLPPGITKCRITDRNMADDTRTCP
jgi:hypothetical protein